MRDVAYLWEEEVDPIRTRFLVFLAISAAIHFLLHYLPMGAPDAVRANIRDVSRDAAAVEGPRRQIRFDVYSSEMRAPAVLSEARLAETPLTRERPAPTRQTLAQPERARAAPGELPVTEGASESDPMLLPAPKAAPKTLPETRAFHPLAAREELPQASPERETVSIQLVRPKERVPELPARDRVARHQDVLLIAPEAAPKTLPATAPLAPTTVRERADRAPVHRRKTMAQRARSQPNRVKVTTARRQMHPRKSLLTDPIASAKPVIPALMIPVHLADRETFEPTPELALALVTAEEMRLTAAERESLVRSQAERTLRAAETYLPLPRTGAPRVPLYEDQRRLPEGWTREGLRAYKDALQAKLSAVRFYPRRSIARGEQGIVTIRFVVDRNGELVGSRVHISSKVPLLDAAALTMVRTAAPYPDFPYEAGADRVLFEVDIVFSLGG